MFKIEGDYKCIQVTANSESVYLNGTTTPSVKYSIHASYELSNMMDRFRVMELEWANFKIEQEFQKKLVETNPAVKEAYATYMAMVQLAKEPI